MEKERVFFSSLNHSLNTVSTSVFYGKRDWPGRPSIQQNFSLPLSIIYYMAENPLSTKGYQKLVQTYLDTFENCTKEHICISQKERRECLRNNFQCCIKIDLNKLSTKIWITRGLYIHKNIQNCFTKILQKNFRSEILHLAVRDNNIIFVDLKFLASFAKRVRLWGNSIKYKNGTIVMLDIILGCLPTNIEYFFFSFGNDVSMVNSSTMQNILKLQNLQHFRYFAMLDCPDTLSIEDLSAFIKKFENTKIDFDFASNVSQEYKEQLDSLIDKIIESGVPNRVISYEGQDQEKLNIMVHRFAPDDAVAFTIAGGDEVDALDNDDEANAEDQHSEDESVVGDDTEFDAGGIFCISFLYKIMNFFKSK